MTKKELANALHNQKYNCAQAVACAFAEDFDIDPQLVFKLCEGFGLGMGCMNGTCGAISGAIAILGLKNSDGNLTAPSTKVSTYQLSKNLHERFKEKNNATICHELKGIANGIPLRSCAGCIEDAVEILEEIIKENI
jgi:C_GCAxxG_C_C family probable redox protein